MKPIRVFFNRWFSVAYHYMNLIRKNPDDVPFTIYATHPDINHMSLQGADIAETEPELTGLAYVEFCLDFCRRHAIDVFIPRLHMLEISRHIARFDEIGTKVLVCRDTELLESVMLKASFYERVRATGIMPVPEYRIVRSAEAFGEACRELGDMGYRICFKPNDSEGGLGFRIIDNKRDHLAELFGYVTPYISLEEVQTILEKASFFPDLMVMELLEGDEYSIDCLSDGEGRLLAAVPRRKAGGRLRLLERHPDFLELAARVAETFRFPYNFNIQMKYNQETAKLLEINPRMSGGLHLSCLSGINFPYLAVKSALGGEVPAMELEADILATHIEQPVIVQRREHRLPERFN